MSYVRPVTAGLPRGLSLIQFIQTVIVGLSGLDGPLVRPKWQVVPPKSPDIDIDWISLGVTSLAPDANAFIDTDLTGATALQRHEAIEVALSLYGPNAGEIAGLIRDGFQIEQNRDALRAANMGFTGTTTPLHVPDLLNERWVNRLEMTVVLARQIQRVYPVPFLVSAAGTVHTVLGDEEYLLEWESKN